MTPWFLTFGPPQSGLDSRSVVSTLVLQSGRTFLPVPSNDLEILLQMLDWSHGGDLDDAMIHVIRDVQFPIDRADSHVSLVKHRTEKHKKTNTCKNKSLGNAVRWQNTEF
jgi:hypothetical protein